MGYTFDGVNKLIVLTNGTVAFTVSDMYSRWKEWVATSDNAKYLNAFASIGGDPLPGGKYAGATFFLENNWKIRPYEGNHTLVIDGNLYSRDGSVPIVRTLGNYNVVVTLTVSNLATGVAIEGGGGTSTSPWDEVLTSHTSEGTFGWFVQKLLTIAKFIGLSK